MTVLVTGGTGRVGMRLVPRLIQQGIPVRVLVRDLGRAEPLIALGADAVVGDVSDAGTVSEALKGAQGVVHLAAAFRGVPEEVITATNYIATAELARAALRAGIERFVYTSTNLIYGVGPGRPAVETDEPQADRPYPVSKTAAERNLLELHGSDGLPVRIFRLAFVYGDGDPHLAESLRWASAWPLDKRLHLVHHADVAQALLRGLWADGADGGIYNVADDAPVTALELLSLNGAQPADEAATRTNDHPFDGIVDTTKIRRQLGFRPIYPTVYSAKAAGAL
jgi:nucleoside-diphosphate-sugar epimerase